MSSKNNKISKSIKNISDNYENFKKKDEIQKNSKRKNIEDFLLKEFEDINKIVDFEKMEENKKNKIIKKYINYKEFLFLKENSKNNKIIQEIKLQKFKMILDNLRKKAEKEKEDKKILNILKNNIIPIVIALISNVISGIIMIYLTQKLTHNKSQNGGLKKNKIKNNIKILNKYEYTDLENITRDIHKLSSKNMSKSEIKSLINKCNNLKMKVPKMRFNNVIQTLSYSTSLLGLIKIQD